MNFMSVYANIYNSTRPISKFFLFYLSMCWSCAGYPIISYKYFQRLSAFLIGIPFDSLPAKVPDETL
jgi:hypothetical protein